MTLMLDPAILFFIVGIAAGAMRSNLEIPPAIARFLSLYLLMSLGLKGGFALAQSGADVRVASGLLAALLMAVIVPLAGYAFLRRHVARLDAAAVAAAYGSVSAVTFVTASQHLEGLGMAAGGHMAAAMALMESPAIILAVLLANAARAAAPARVQGSGTVALAGGPASIGGLLRESLTDGSQVLLLGAMAVGLLSGEAGKSALQPFTGDLFKGMLSLFLLDMGLLVARNFAAARRAAAVLVGYATLGPLLHAATALALAWLLRLPAGDAALLMVLSASASYIVVPAVLRHAIPEANPALYLGLSLGITFPLNVLLGIPLYAAAARLVLG